jgi:hypothetical protein
MNLDEDHLSDFKNVGAGVVAAWLVQPKNLLPGPQPDFGGIEIRWYYPFFILAENTTNDLNFAVIAQFGTFKILFTGDLEVAGWQRFAHDPGVLPGRAGRHISQRRSREANPRVKGRTPRS